MHETPSTDPRRRLPTCTVSLPQVCATQAPEVDRRVRLASRPEALQVRRKPSIWFLPTFQQYSELQQQQQQQQRPCMSQ